MAAPTINSARAAINGGEMGHFGRNAPTDGNITLQTGIKRTGSYAFRVQAASGVKSTWQFNSDDAFINMSSFFFRGYIYISTLPASTRAIIDINGVALSTTAPGLRLRSTGVLEFHDGSSLIAAGSTPLVTGQWYRIEVGANTTDDVVSLKINGALEIDWTSTGNIGTFSSIGLGAIDTVAATFDLYWDDLAIDATDWCGPGRVVALRPNGAGTSTVAGFTAAGSSPAATKYQSLNEATPDDAVTYVLTSAVSGDRETYTLDDLPADAVAIRGVKFAIRIRRDGASNGICKIMTKVWGHIKLYAQHSSTASFVWFEDLGNSSPTQESSAVGGQWTIDRVNALEIGIENLSTNKTDVSMLVCEVDYDDTPGVYAVTDRLYASGFEAGDITADGSVTGTAALATNVARTGTYSLRVNPAGNTSSFLSTGAIAAGTNKEVFISFYLYVTARPTSTSTMQLVAVKNGGNIQGSVRMDSAGKLKLEDRSGLIGSLSASAIPLNTWTRIDFRLRCSVSTSSADGYLEALVNGVSVLSASTPNSDNNAWTIINFGTPVAPGAGGCDVNYDDCIVDSTYWVNPVDDIRVVDLLPTAAGLLSGSGFAAVGQANQWDCLDETPTNGDTDYVTTGTSTSGLGTYTTQDITASAGAVRSVSVAGSFKRDGAINGIIYSSIRTNGHTPRSTSVSSGAAYAWQRNILRNTDRDGAWTAALVNNSELSIANLSANTSRCSNLRASVEYALAGGAGPGGSVAQAAIVGF